jgi:carbon-monoxide dehydrogenase small subunit
MKIPCMLNNRMTMFNTYSDKPLNRIFEEETSITSVNTGCSGGQCGNCVILVDDKPVLSCLLPAFSAAGKNLVTFEGFAKSKFYTDIRKAYEKHHIQPCSYCYASKTLIIHGLLTESADPEPEEILRSLSVNNCTCVDRVELINVVKTAAAFRRRRHRVRRS